MGDTDFKLRFHYFGLVGQQVVPRVVQHVDTLWICCRACCAHVVRQQNKPRIDLLSGARTLILAVHSTLPQALQRSVSCKVRCSTLYAETKYKTPDYAIAFLL